MPSKALYKTKTLLLICEGGGLCFLDNFICNFDYLSVLLLSRKNVVKHVIEISRK